MYTQVERITQILQYAAEKSGDHGRGCVGVARFLSERPNEIPNHLLNHGFAKAFWSGEPCTCEPDSDVEGNTYHKPDCQITTPDWRCHLQNAVLAEDLVEYYFNHLPDAPGNRSHS